MARKTDETTAGGKGTDADRRFEGELRRGVLQLAALHLLERPRYGYDLVRRLGELGFAVEEGTLYPILRRFEKAGVLSSRWDTEGKRPRKYYNLSDEGRRLRDGMMAAWGRVRAATDSLLHQAGAELANEQPVQAAVIEEPVEEVEEQS